MSQIRKNDHRLMQILLGPIVSEKATMVAEKNEQEKWSLCKSLIKKVSQSALADLRDDAITPRKPMSI